MGNIISVEKFFLGGLGAKVLFMVCISLCMFIALQESQSEEGKENKVIWNSWNEQLFDRARTEKKLILLNLQASWCHWCHVMDDTTYRDQGVQQILQKSFVLVAVQQDSHPALSSRYREYGWPATVILNDAAEEIEILSGYIEPEEFKATLRRIIANPRRRKDKSGDIPDITRGTSLEKTLFNRFHSSLDHTLGGLRTSHRYLDSDSLEFALREGLRGDRESLEWFHNTLKANRSLIDPVWGGVYQYSTGRKWSNPHFEKLISSQATALFLYSLGSGSDPTRTLYQEDLHNVVDYVKGFLLSPLGGFYVSQSAVVEGVSDNTTYFALDDDARRAKGAPAIDVHEFGRETALGIDAVLYAYRALGDPSLLDQAIHSGKWLIENRVQSDGTVTHDRDTTGEFFLADSIATAKALLHLHAVTGDVYWLQRGEVVVTQIVERFKSSDGIGFLSSRSAASTPTRQRALTEHISLSENLCVGRVLNLYSYYLKRDSLRDAAQSSLRAVRQPQLAFSTISEPGILLLTEELSRPPLHITLIGDSSAERTEKLWAEILKTPDSYLQLERLTFVEAQNLTNSRDTVRYPKVNQPAAFLCANRTCSLPIFTPEELRSTLTVAIKKSDTEKIWK